MTFEVDTIECRAIWAPTTYPILTRLIPQLSPHTLHRHTVTERIADVVGEHIGDPIADPAPPAVRAVAVGPTTAHAHLRRLLQVPDSLPPCEGSRSVVPTYTKLNSASKDAEVKLMHQPAIAAHRPIARLHGLYPRVTCHGWVLHAVSFKSRNNSGADIHSRSSNIPARARIS